MRNATNPKMLITGGLWYVLAPKVGSIFRHSKHELFKDIVLLFLSWAAPITVRRVSEGAVHVVLSHVCHAAGVCALRAASVSCSLTPHSSVDF